MAVTLELWMGERGDKWEWKEEQPSEKAPGTGDRVCSRTRAIFLYVGFFMSHVQFEAERLFPGTWKKIILACVCDMLIVV